MTSQFVGDRILDTIVWDISDSLDEASIGEGNGNEIGIQ